MGGGGGGLPSHPPKFFRPWRPQFGLTIRGARGSPGSTTAMELQNMCIRSFFRVVCYFWSGDGSGSESYAKQKEKKKNIMGPCTKPAYTGKGFCFRVFHRTNVFSINFSFFGLFVRPVSHFGPRYSNERKSQSETKKPHVPQLITKSPTKLKDVCK